ncbi:hypothetical protein CSV61_14365 [Sporosarcina sp. P3]|uniref:hypothetical protein n=1 Tax=Sporosarcina sp. P3 TaxID=2048245 RepID=UPI000C167170|nr:hypothetical protein [Sporosarcina sp. P3]PID20450.1 hypothetical protein CSV61_14365 [Sporosarcina sp. P3]
MKDAEKGLAVADIAVYLVYSMQKLAKLSQGTFEDMDVILMDNFAQSAKKQEVKQIVYYVTQANMHAFVVSGCCRHFARILVLLNVIA